MSEEQFWDGGLVNSDVGDGSGTERLCECVACDCLRAELTLMRRRVRTLHAELGRARAARALHAQTAV